MDGIQHNFASSTRTSPGLRGGTVTVDTDFQTLHFDHARFTRDVSVTGTIIWTDVLNGDLTLRSSDGRTKDVHMRGHWLDENPHNLFVTMRVGGPQVRFAVPST